MQNPTLVEPGIYYFHNKILQHCHGKRVQYHNLVYNIILLILFILIFGSILFFKYKGKLTPKDKLVKQQKERIYILNKIKSLNIQKQKNTLITDLPTFNSEYDYLNQKY